MARIGDVELARLKAEVSLVRLVEAKGIALARHGANGDVVGSCPFHEVRLPKVERGLAAETRNGWEIARRVAVGSGESRGSLKMLAQGGRILGPAFLALGVGLGIHAVASAPQDQRGRTAAREIGAFVLGAAGATAGMTAGVAAAGFTSGFLIGLGIVSGPIGWLAIGLGLAGGALVGLWWSRRGGQIAESIYGMTAQ